MTTTELTAEAFSRAVDYLNNEQKESVLNFAHVLAGLDWATDATITDIDESGLNLDAIADIRSDSARIDFSKVVDSERSLQMTLMGLAMDADIPDGIERVATATVTTPKAGRYLKALCNHFDRGANANYEIDDDDVGHGSVTFNFGECHMRSSADVLNLRVTANSEIRFNRMKGVIDSHLVRFAQKEELQIEWE